MDNQLPELVQEFREVLTATALDHIAMILLAKAMVAAGASDPIVEQIARHGQLAAQNYIIMSLALHAIEGNELPAHMLKACAEQGITIPNEILMAKETKVASPDVAKDQAADGNTEEDSDDKIADLQAFMAKRKNLH